MALSSRKEIPASKPGKPCSISLVYDAVSSDPVELRELNAILYEEGNSQGQVFNYLAGDGFTIGYQSVNRHRGKSCRCFQETPSRFCLSCKYDLASCTCGGQ